jgi:hypothetical protein
MGQQKNIWIQEIYKNSGVVYLEFGDPVYECGTLGNSGFSLDLGGGISYDYDYSTVDLSTKICLARLISSHLVLRKLLKTTCAFEVEDEPAR